MFPNHVYIEDKRIVILQEISENNYWYYIFYSHTVDGKSVLHGVVSWGVNCGDSETPGSSYANVFNMMGFVNDVLVWFYSSHLEHTFNATEWEIFKCNLKHFFE